MKSWLCRLFAAARRREEDRLAVRREAANGISAGMPGEPGWRAAGRGDGIDVEIAVVLSTEGDGLAVGEKTGFISTPMSEVSRRAFLPSRSATHRSSA